MKKERFSLIAAILFVCMFTLSCGSTPAPVETIPEPEPVPVVAQEPTPVVETPPPPPAPPPPSPPAPPAEVKKQLVMEGSVRHKVLHHETLSEVAARVWGQDYAYWFPVIMAASEGAVKNPERIVPGMELVIPDLQKNIKDEGARAFMKEKFLSAAEDYRRIGRYGVAGKLVKIADSL